MSTIQIFVIEQEDLIKVVYTQGNSPKQKLEEYPNSYLETHGGQVKIYESAPCGSQNLKALTLVVPTSRTIIKYIK